MHHISTSIYVLYIHTYRLPTHLYTYRHFTSLPPPSSTKTPSFLPPLRLSLGTPTHTLPTPVFRSGRRTDACSAEERRGGGAGPTGHRRRLSPNYPYYYSLHRPEPVTIQGSVRFDCRQRARTFLSCVRCTSNVSHLSVRCTSNVCQVYVRCMSGVCQVHVRCVAGVCQV